MKNLLTAMRSALKTGLAGVRNRDIFVTEDTDVIPDSLGFPAVGLKDGPVARKRIAADLWEATRTVTVIAYVRITKPEAAVMGANGATGVLDLAAAIRAVLDDNLLGLSGYTGADCYAEGASDLFGDEKEALQRKLLTYTYTQDESS